MFKKYGKSGGFICASNILNPHTNIEADGAFRFASTSIREAAKIGLQTLYANPEEALNRYKDFDIVKEMKARKGSKLLWVRARAIDADITNTNGDFFSKEELLKKVDYKGDKIPAYKTFEGVPIYSNHQNENIEDARGMVVYAEWDEDENCVYCTFFIDEEAYPDVARGIRYNYMKDVSMGASVEEGECSICGNIATTESQWCSCLKKFKGRKHPDLGKLVYEINRGLKFIELSVVGDGAFDACEVKELYEPDEILEFADSINQKAASIHANISLAAVVAPNDKDDKLAYESCLRQITSTTDTIIKLAQQAGNLVGGQLLALDNASQNATVTNILQYLGIDSKTGLNVLDLMNLALNFLEVAVMNLFSRKDNIDLAHVGKITKSMADLQSTMQDLIDDGMTNNGVVQPPNAAATPPAATPEAAQPAPEAQLPGQAQAILPPQPSTGAETTNQGAAALPGGQPNAFGGGISEQVQKLARANKFLHRLASFAKMVSEDNSNNAYNNDNGGNTLMSFAEQFTHNFDTAQNLYEVECDLPNAQYKVVLSSNGATQGFINGNKTKFAPTITESEKELMNQGNVKEAAKQVMDKFIKIAETIFEVPSVTQQVNDLPHKEPVLKGTENKLVKDHIYDGKETPEKTLEERTESRRHKVRQPIENRLGEEGWNGRKGNKIKTMEQLLDNALPRGVDDRTIEEKLKEQQQYKCKNAVANVEKVIIALATAAVTTGMTPDEIVDGAQNVAEAGPDAISKAKTIQENGDDIPLLDEKPDMAAVGSLAEQVDDTTSSADLHTAVTMLLKDLGTAIKSVETAVEKFAENETVTPKIDDSEPTDEEKVGADLAIKNDTGGPDVDHQDVQAAVSSVANTVDQLGVSPDQVLNAAHSASPDDIQKQIELNKQPSSLEVRSANAKRINYYGYTKKASKNTILKTLIGHLADYSLGYNLRSKDLAYAICSMKDVPAASKQLIAQALNQKRQVIAATMRDEQSSVKELTLTVEDLGMDIKVSSPDFEEVLKHKVVDLLQNAGYSVDANNFNMNSVDVSPEGQITVRVESRFNRIYDINNDKMALHGDEARRLLSFKDASEQEHGLDSNVNVPYPNGEEPHQGLTPREAKRNKLMQKFSQAVPGLAGGAPGGAAGGLGGGVGSPGGAGLAGGLGTPPAPAPATPGTDLLGGEGAPGGSISAFTSSPGPETPEAGAPSDEGDQSHTPGVKKPWGAVCPQCQSLEVDIAGGEGKCNACGAQLKYEFIVHVAPPDKNEKYKGSLDPKTADMGMADESTMGSSPSEVGLGAATAPAGPEMGMEPGAGLVPPAPQTPGAPGELPLQGTQSGSPVVAHNDHFMMRVSYKAAPELFIDTPAVKTARKLYSAGMICPICTSSKVDKKDTQSRCKDCGQVFMSSIVPDNNDPNTLNCSISYII